MSSFFEVDKEGLKALVADRPKSFIIRELVQNAWDEQGVTQVNITLEHDSQRRRAMLTVEDDAPEGFYDIRHAFTLFADTRKRKDPTKRGRFNIGEKQVLALCKSAEILTTTAAVRFEENGKRTVLRGKKREAGSLFSAVLLMTKKEYEEVCSTVMTFLPPASITTVFNGERIPYRKPGKTFTARLLTEIADDLGSLRPSQRNTSVDVLEPLEDETPTLYEMGLPVVETGDRWHYNVNQRVPLSMDRDNVKPSYLRDLRAEVLNHMKNKVTPDDCGEQWVQDGMSDPRVESDVVRVIIRKQHGDKPFVPVPGDPKAKERAIAMGYDPVSSHSHGKDAWDNIRKAGAIPSAVEVAGNTCYTDYEIIPRDKWTEGMKRISNLTKFIARIGGITVNVAMIKSPDAHTLADYGNGSVSFNVSRLGRGWFEPVCSEEQIDLIIHELGHEGGGHLEMGYHEMLTKIGARLALIPPEELASSARGT